jgi:asparagine synthase (glutamine-hydrolysing)
VVRQFWRPPEEIVTRRQPLDDAAEELRALLADAVRERLATTGPTAISLSGGWDSSAVYGTAQSILREHGEDPHLVHPVSISYPEGDPGREDELIQSIVGHWGQQPDFIDIATIPLFDQAEVRAQRRDGPFAHAYEEWNRRLSRQAKAAGARVILDGVGGDQLFQVTDVYLADLFRTGRWLELAHQFRIRSGGNGSLRSFYRWAVRPVLPAPLVRGISALRRLPPPAHYLDREPPFWLRRKFLDAHQVLERDAAARPALPPHSAVLAESHAYLRFAFYPRIFGLLHEFASDEGIEVRSPLLDERVVRFAVQRPWSDRADGAETKLLLRRAMRGLLPEHVLAPRPHRTGITSAYFLRQMRAEGWGIAQRVLPDLRLADLGMIDASAFRRVWEHILQHDNDELAARAFFTLQAELWIRERET